ncbi:PIN domain-containing protein [Microbacterium bovistercoris]|uniref:PIN domain-containing protein n=1 Tax=Microbacterium bovistercoris TaxID=2293570 RepID=UPI0015F28DF2|nr:PIN domain-containing protein [Microbacterium bovistercoris]
MILLDTNAVIRIDELSFIDDSLALSALTLAELQFGIEHAKDPSARRRRRDELSYVRHTLGVPELPFDREAAEGYGRMAAIVAKTRPAHARSTDTFLAGHAFALGAAIMTFNARDFELVADEVEIIDAGRQG